MTQRTPSPSDSQLLEKAFEIATLSLNLHGEVRPFGIIEGSDGCYYSNENDGSFSEIDKDIFAAIMKAGSVVHRAVRLAFMSESWAVVSKDPAAMEYAIALQEAGKSLQEHPDVTEVVFVTVQTHDAHIMEMRPLERLHPGWVTLGKGDPPECVSTSSSGEGLTMHGRFSNLLAPLAIQRDPDAVSFAKSFIEGFNIEFIKTDSLRDAMKAKLPQMRNSN